MPATGNKPYHPLSLSIRIHADGFSFFVCDLQTSSLIRGEHFRRSESCTLAEQLLQELCRPDYFNRQIDQCFVLICSPSTHVPLEDFRRDEAAALYGLTFTCEDMSHLRVAYNILPQLECAELYAVPLDVEEAILQFYPTARFFASRAILMERLLSREEDIAQPQAERRLWVVAEADGLALYAFDNRRLRFANTFDVATSADALYFVLNVWQLLELDAQKDHLMMVAPQNERDDSLVKSLAEYLMHIDVVSPTDLFPHVPLAREKQMPVDLMALLLNRI
ncbi:MAG: DUF3822 family protein [Bacteroidaceae bacterium]|nr:DUF3822 family protein [Bacteroidaceae bacterium]